MPLYENSFIPIPSLDAAISQSLPVCLNVCTLHLKFPSDQILFAFSGLENITYPSLLRRRTESFHSDILKAFRSW